MYETTFDAFVDAAKSGLLCIEGCVCHYEFSRDNDLRLLAIVATQIGAGYRALQKLIEIAKEHECPMLIAWCPVNLPSNKWYEKTGWTLNDGDEEYNMWVMYLE